MQRAPRHRGRPPTPTGEARGAHRAGISLFEVILSLVILVTSLAAIGQLVSGGGRGAIKARLMTQGVFLAESKMAEFVSGAASLAAMTDAPITGEENWTYSVIVANGPQTDLYDVTVEVKHTANSSLGTVQYSLSRMVRDPGAMLATRVAEEERQAAETAESEATAARSAAATKASGSSTGSNGSTGGGAASGATRNTGTSGR